MVVIEIAPEYGYCILTAIASSLMITWKGLQVGKMRKKFKISYPTMYSQDNDLFNCYQRAHQNTLENYPTFLMLLFIGGVYHPVMCSIGGWVWIASRIAYALGYYTGDPKKRMRGTFGYLGIFTMLYCSVRLATRMLGCF